MLKTIISLIVCFVGCLNAGTAQDRANVVFILSDDQAWGDYGFMGHPEISTPHLDTLAKESLVFKHGYVTAPLCRPSLASIVSGLYLKRDHGRDTTRYRIVHQWDQTPEHLYDLLADPGEQHNLISHHPKVVKDLRQRLAIWSR